MRLVGEEEGVLERCGCANRSGGFVGERGVTGESCWEHEGCVYWLLREVRWLD